MAKRLNSVETARLVTWLEGNKEIVLEHGHMSAALVEIANKELPFEASAAIIETCCKQLGLVREKSSGCEAHKPNILARLQLDERQVSIIAEKLHELYAALGVAEDQTLKSLVEAFRKRGTEQ